MLGSMCLYLLSCLAGLPSTPTLDALLQQPKANARLKYWLQLVEYLYCAGNWDFLFSCVVEVLSTHGVVVILFILQKWKLRPRGFKQ